jgi:hypothetical protein
MVRLRTPLRLFKPVGTGAHPRDWLSTVPTKVADATIFYPVLHEEYAVHIARGRNATDAATAATSLGSGSRSAFLQNYDVQTVGSSRHRENWIPADDVAAFNDDINGPIEVIYEFQGAGTAMNRNLVTALSSTYARSMRTHRR